MGKNSMENIWDTFWKEKGKKIEWSQEDVLHSKEFNELHNRILFHSNKNTLKEVSMLEIGAGMGLASLFFAHKGVSTDLLDQSKESKSLAKEYWGNRAKHNFIIADLFTFKSEKKYDIVTSFGLCEHFAGKQRCEVLQKHLVFLKDKGIAIISVPNKYGIFYRIAKKLAELTGFWSFGLEIPFSKKELTEFAKSNNLGYEIIMWGFYASAYDLIVRKPLKVLKISTKRRFDETASIFDKYFGGNITIILKKGFDSE